MTQHSSSRNPCETQKRAPYSTDRNMATEANASVFCPQPRGRASLRRWVKPHWRQCRAACVPTSSWPTSMPSTSSCMSTSPSEKTGQTSHIRAEMHIPLHRNPQLSRQCPNCFNAEQLTAGPESHPVSYECLVSCMHFVDVLATSNFATLSPVVPSVCRRWSRWTWRLAMPSWRRCSICHWAGQWHICLLIWAGNWHSWDCLRWTPQRKWLILPISHCLVMLAYLKGSDAYLCCGLISFASYFKMTPQSEGIDQKQELQMEPTHQCLRCCKWKVVGHIVN